MEENNKYEIILKNIKIEFPNLPIEVINLWIFPIAEKKGWPPSEHNQWDKKVSGEQFSFWNDAKWEKVTLNLGEINYSQSYFNTMIGLRDAYMEGKQNNYALLENGKQRFLNCLRYILENGKFPQSPILCLDEFNEYCVLDGNHRFCAFLSAERLYKEYQTNSIEEQEFLKKMEIANIKLPNIEQEVWICIPKWENSSDAQARLRLRELGFY